MKQIKEIKLEIREILSKKESLPEKSEILQKAGYKIEFNWVKYTSLGSLNYLKRQKLYRIPYSPPELCGNYYKAWCIVLPAYMLATDNHCNSVFDDDNFF